jgi:hypothetical protein
VVKSSEEIHALWPEAPYYILGCRIALRKVLQSTARQSPTNASLTNPDNRESAPDQLVK